MRKYIAGLLLLLLSLLSANSSLATLGTVKGYISPSTSNVKVGDKFSVKIMLDTSTYKLSAVSLNLNIDTAKVKVTQVFLNMNVFNGALMNSESGGVVSLYGTNSMATANLPKGVLEVGSMSLEAIAAGTVNITAKSFELVGPSTTNDYSYGLDWQAGSLVVGGNVVIPTATPILGNGTDGVLKFKMSFSGVVSSALCANNWSVDVTMLENNGNRKSFQNVALSPDGTTDGLVSFRGQVLLSGITTKSNLAVFLNGSRHLQTKYAVNGQTDFYNQAGGNIVVDSDPNKTVVYDFSKYPLLAGDVNNDGRVDGLDFSIVKTDVGKRSEGANLVADLNGNCKLESQDLSLLMLAMKDKQEQLY